MRQNNQRTGTALSSASYCMQTILDLYDLKKLIRRQLTMLCPLFSKACSRMIQTPMGILMFTIQSLRESHPTLINFTKMIIYSRKAIMTIIKILMKSEVREGRLK